MAWQVVLVIVIFLVGCRLYHLRGQPPGSNSQDGSAHSRDSIRAQYFHQDTREPNASTSSVHTHPTASTPPIHTLSAISNPTGPGPPSTLTAPSPAVHHAPAQLAPSVRARELSAPLPRHCQEKLDSFDHTSKLNVGWTPQYFQCTDNDPPLPYNNTCVGLAVLSLGVSNSLIASMWTWHRSGLIQYAQLMDVFINQIRPIDCRLKCTFNFPINVFGSSDNVGIGGAIEFLIPRIQCGYVVFMEDDWQLSSPVAPIIEAHRFLLTTTPKAHGPIYLKAFPSPLERLDGLSDAPPGICKNWTILNAAVRKHMFKNVYDCMQMKPEKFYKRSRQTLLFAAQNNCPFDVLRFAMRSCLGDRDNITAEGVTYAIMCAKSSYFHWMNCPFIGAKEWLLKHVLPYIRKCTARDQGCLYGQLELNRPLGCRVKFSGTKMGSIIPGLFLHMNLDKRTRQNTHRLRYLDEKFANSANLV
eukprot:NODE_1849_length_1586_cov_25.647984_g1760_i0.p1 GENE.NODE_1849_length_1586_cov_25.647984_g1760_i0~~NODE_1849_length_1586_cov_25.647984_g1760_i0.p1  ORF type:complete len:470 (+),score=24.33 NODE_1849_length_1586_cov_25.647984_g1760_i0:50-1459(+)